MPACLYLDYFLFLTYTCFQFLFYSNLFSIFLYFFSLIYIFHEFPSYFWLGSVWHGSTMISIPPVDSFLKALPLHTQEWKMALHLDAWTGCPAQDVINICSSHID